MSRMTVALSIVVELSKLSFGGRPVGRHAARERHHHRRGGREPIGQVPRGRIDRPSGSRSSAACPSGSRGGGRSSSSGSATSNADDGHGAMQCDRPSGLHVRASGDAIAEIVRRHCYHRTRRPPPTRPRHARATRLRMRRTLHRVSRARSGISAARRARLHGVTACTIVFADRRCGDRDGVRRIARSRFRRSGTPLDRDPRARPQAPGDAVRRDAVVPLSSASRLGQRRARRRDQGHRLPDDELRLSRRRRRVLHLPRGRRGRVLPLRRAVRAGRRLHVRPDRPHVQAVRVTGRGHVQQVGRRVRAEVRVHVRSDGRPAPPLRSGQRRRLREVRRAVLSVSEAPATSAPAR